MNALFALSPAPLRILLLMVLMLCFFTLCYAVIAAFLYRLGSRFCFICILQALLCLSYFMPMIALHRARVLGAALPPIHRPFTRLALSTAVGLVALTFLIALLTLRRIYLASRAKPTMISFKEATDFLPKGLCFSSLNGQVHMTNPRMTALCHLITGGPLRNANHFWQAVIDNRDNELLYISDDKCLVILRLSDSSIWGFSRAVLPFGKSGIYQTLATRLSKEWEKYDELQQAVERLEQTNRRLKDFDRLVYDVVREEEKLALKIELHDSLGKLLTRARHELRAPQGSLPRQSLLHDLAHTLHLFQTHADQKPQEDPFESLVSAAKFLSMTVDVHGTLPQSDRSAVTLFHQAARECLTNAARHGHARTLIIHIDEEDGGIQYTFTNDGIPPTLPIREGTGLSALRTLCQNLGAELTLDTQGRFAVTVRYSFDGAPKI